MKRFNVTGTCFPEKHYMVDISSNLNAMHKMVDEGIYFTINRGRQYGKTTTLSGLNEKLEKAGYIVFSISFEAVGEEAYESEECFYKSFLWLLSRQITYGLVKNAGDELVELLEKYADNEDGISWKQMDMLISRMCSISPGKVVVMIDEVDQAGNFQVFLKFLGLLRSKYLSRDRIPTFHSVILAGVYDIKNLKLKLRSDEEHQLNSPWNIAVGYDKDMSLSEAGIAGMLSEYEADHSTGMDVAAMAKRLRDYTSGYPFLVSRLCQIMDAEEKEDSWTAEGFQRAVKAILGESNTLFDDMVKKLVQFPKLHDMLYEILYTGRRVTFNRDDREINIAGMFGYIYDKNGAVAIANRILEMRLYNLFVTEASKVDDIYRSGSVDRTQFIKDGVLDMKRILERFVWHYTEIYGDRDERFHEKEGRKFFLFYLKPIINGTGNSYVEAETLDEGRMDVVVDYLGKQYVIELKIWRGPAYHEEGEKQLAGYLDSMHLDHGYMLTFNFNQKKENGVQERFLDGKRIYEAFV